MVLSVNDISEVKKTIVDEISKTFELQGHKLTGALIQNIEWQVAENTDSIILNMLMAKYGIFLDTGVKKENIPYSPPSVRGGKSAYISGLIGYVEKRMGLTGRKGKSVAFAIAAKHIKEGMPTLSSKKFSQSGNRTKFLTRSLDDPKLSNDLQDIIGDSIRLRIENNILDLVKKYELSKYL